MREQQLLAIICDILDVKISDIHLNSSRNDIEEWDSLAHIQIIAEIEEMFDIKIPFEEIHSIERVSDILKYL